MLIPSGDWQLFLKLTIVQRRLTQEATLQDGQLCRTDLKVLWLDLLLQIVSTARMAIQWLIPPFYRYLQIDTWEQSAQL